MGSTQVPPQAEQPSINQLGTSRIELHDIELHGETIRSGDVVTVSLAAANKLRLTVPPEEVPLRHEGLSHGVHRLPVDWDDQ